MMQLEKEGGSSFRSRRHGSDCNHFCSAASLPYHLEPGHLRVSVVTKAAVLWPRGLHCCVAKVHKAEVVVRRAAELQ